MYVYVSRSPIDILEALASLEFLEKLRYISYTHILLHGIAYNESKQNQKTITKNESKEKQIQKTNIYIYI